MKPLDDNDLILRGTRTVDAPSGGRVEMAYAIALDELLRWLAHRAEVNAGSKTQVLHGMIEARIVGRTQSADH
jgi:hypothetical protein